MNPKKIAKESEHSQQTALFCYANLAYWHGFDEADRIVGTDGKPKMLRKGVEPAVPALLWLHAIPNGGMRGDSTQSRKIRGGQLKAEGVKQGVADIFLPYPSAGMHGLYIEMKKPSLRPKRKGGKGGLSDAQISFKNYVQSVDYGFLTCYSWDEAAKLIRQYIEWSERHE